MTYADTLAQLVRALRAADTRDPNLTPDANLRRKHEARETALQAARSTLHEACTTTATKASDTARRAATAATGGHRDAAQLIAREQAWRRAEMLLAAGRPLDDVIAGADTLTLEAVADGWAESWARAQAVRPDRETDPAGHHHFEEPDTTGIMPAVVARLAETADDPKPYAAAIAAGQEAERAATYSDMLGEMENPGRISGGTMNRLHSRDPEGYRVIKEA